MIPRKLSDFDRTAHYLGDGLYADFDGDIFRLFSSNGIDILSEVFLDLTVLGAFRDYVKSLLVPPDETSGA
jgi:hypothetical protein